MIWCRSWQSLRELRWDSTRAPARPAEDSREESSVAWEMAAWRERRASERIEGLMVMEMDSFRESRQAAGYGVVWHRD